jgi:hypothetical protein
MTKSIRIIYKYMPKKKKIPEDIIMEECPECEALRDGGLAKKKLEKLHQTAGHQPLVNHELEEEEE